MRIDRWSEVVAYGQDLKRKRLGVLGAEGENRLRLFAGFLSNEGKALGTLKPERSIHISSLGFS